MPHGACVCEEVRVDVGQLGQLEDILDGRLGGIERRRADEGGHGDGGGGTSARGDDGGKVRGRGEGEGEAYMLDSVYMDKSRRHMASQRGMSLGPGQIAAGNVPRPVWRSGGPVNG
jgi:hypothetical protein